MVFANIFAGMQVATGQNGCAEITMMEVPIRYGATDRVAGAIASGNTQNNLHTLPMISFFMTSMAAAPDRQKGIGAVDRRTYLAQGDVFPTDVKMIERLMPIPYNLTFELAIFASNTDQMFQIIEQIAIVFDYDLQVQFNDAAFDWAKITKVTFDGDWRNETNYPVGTDRQAIIWSASFTFETWLSPPMSVRDNLIHQIRTNIGKMDNCVIEEYDETGELIPFNETYDAFALGIGVGGIGGLSTDIEPADPVADPNCLEHYDPSTDPECHAQPPSNGSNALPR